MVRAALTRHRRSNDIAPVSVCRTSSEKRNRDVRKNLPLYVLYPVQSHSLRRVRLVFLRSLSRNPVTCPCTFASVIGALLPVLKKKKNTIFQLDYNHLNKLTGSQVEEFVIEGCVFLGTFSTYVQHPQKKDKRLLVSLLT